MRIKCRAWYLNKMRSWDDILTTFDIGFLDNHDVMQYTGLKDKNGKEIYEGDIIKMVEPRTGQNFTLIYQVKYSGWTFYIENIKSETRGGKHKYDEYVIESLYIRCDAKHREVIGNIYENEDLLSN